MGSGREGQLNCTLPAIPEMVTRGLQTARLLPSLCPRLPVGTGASGKKEMATYLTCQVEDVREREEGKLARQLVFSPFHGPGLKLFCSLLAAVASSGLLGACGDIPA